MRPSVSLEEEKMPKEMMMALSKDKSGNQIKRTVGCLGSQNRNLGNNCSRTRIVAIIPKTMAMISAA